jgi:ribosomal protein S18 acetylase RimI-like enzyme
MEIREARAADAETLHALNVELQEFERRGCPSRLPGEELPVSYIQGLLSDLQSGRSKIFVAHEDTSVVAFLACELREDVLEQDPLYVYITDMVVTASRRGQGIGRQLMAAAEAFAREHGARTITVTALVSNSSAQGIYRRLGFHEEAVTFERSVI